VWVQTLDREQVGVHVMYICMCFVLGVHVMYTLYGVGVTGGVLGVGPDTRS